MALDVDNVSGALQKAAAEMTRILEEAKQRVRLEEIKLRESSWSRFVNQSKKYRYQFSPL